MTESVLPPLDPAKGAWDERELTRRQFLVITFWAVTGVVTVGVAAASARYLVGDSLEPRKSNWVQVGPVSDLPAGSVHKVNYALKAKDAWREVERKGTLYVSSADGAAYTILDGTCTHLGCVVQWQEADGAFNCPCHSAVFNREGAVVSGPPPRALRRLEAKVEDGVLWAQI